MKFCKDCKHIIIKQNLPDSLCVQCPWPGNGVPDLVTGVVKEFHGFMPCVYARIFEEYCGKQAKYFEPVDKTQPMNDTKDVNEQKD